MSRPTVGTTAVVGASVPTVAPRAGGTREEVGAVTAEAAAVLPVLVAVAVALVWLVSLVVTQVRVVDAAREVARAAARGDSKAAAITLGRRVAPEGTTFDVRHGGGVGGVELVTVTAAADVRGPGGLLSFLPGVDVQSTAVTQLEPR